MNYWKHSLLSKKKFGGQPEDYLPIHKLLDSSKLFYYNIKHRILLHNTYGIDLCVRKFGETILSSDHKIVLVRDIAAEHCREDLYGVVPTLNNWFTYTDPDLSELIKPVVPDCPVLKEFVLQPFLMSGLQASLMITQSNFGIYLAKEMLGIDYAIELAKYVTGNSINELLQFVKCTEKWQYLPDVKQLKQIDNELI